MQQNFFRFFITVFLIALFTVPQFSIAQSERQNVVGNSEFAPTTEGTIKAPQQYVPLLTPEQLARIRIPNIQITNNASDGPNAVYLSQDFEVAFTGTPAAPPTWTQSRVVLLGDGTPEPNGTDGEKDWQQNTWTGTAWMIPSTATVNPTGAVSGTSVLWMHDYNFGSTGSGGFGSRRMESPNVNLTTSTSPYVRFHYFYAAASTGLNVKVMASSNGGTTWNPIMVIPPNANTTSAMTVATPWQRINVLIPSAYRTANAKFGIEMTNIWGTNDIFIDDFVVEDFTPTTITSAASGNWSNIATWVGGVLPTADNHVVIDAGHAVLMDVNIARCQNLTVNGTLGYSSTSTSMLNHIFGNLTVNAGGVYNSYFGTTGKRTMLGGSFVNNGTSDFSVGAGNLVWLGGAPATLGGTGTFTNSFVSNVWHLNSGGVTYNIPIEVRNTCGLYEGLVNPNGNLTLGNIAVVTQTIEKTSRGSFTSLPNYTAGIRRTVAYITANLAPLTEVLYSTSLEVPVVSGVGILEGGLTMSTYDNVSLSTPVDVGTTTAGSLSLGRGILITSNTNLLTVNSSIAGPSGTAPSILTPSTTHGSYISGPVRFNFPASGTTTRNFALGVGTAFNGPTPTSNVLKTVLIGTTSTAWTSQTVKLSITGAPSGTVNGPLTNLMGPRGYYVDLLGGPELPATATIQIRGRNSTFGNSDNMIGDISEIRVAQSTSLTGPWSERSLTSGAGVLLDNTDYLRTTATIAPGPIAPIGTNGGYFALATTQTIANPSGVTATPFSTTRIDVAFTPNISNHNVVIVWNDSLVFTTPAGAPPAVGQPFAGGTMLFNGTASPYLHTPVSPTTTYYYKLFSYDGTVYSAGVNVNATTPANPVGLPFTQDFEGTTFPSLGWSTYGAKLWTQTLTDGRGGTKGARISYTPAGTGNLQTLPVIIPASPVSRIKFWWKDDDILSRSGDNSMIIGQDTTYFEISTNGGTTWTILTFLSEAAPSADYFEVIQNLAAYAGQTVTFRWRDISNGLSAAYGTGLDDVTVELVPACVEPSNLTTTNITATSVSIGWSGAATVEIDYGTVGHPAGTGTVITNIVTNPYSLGGLSANTSYDVYVRQNCGAGQFSAWTGPLNFSTLCATVNAPWMEDFETGTFPPNCWSLVGTSNWLEGLYSGYGNGLYSAFADFYSISSGATFDLVSLSFDASALTTPVVKFDWAYSTYTGGETDTLKIYYSTNSGSTWVLLQTMPGGPAGILNPFALQTGPEYVPADDEWSTISYSIPNTANMVKFTAISDFGNSLFVDNIKVIQPLANDVGTTSVDLALNLSPGSVAPKATVKNFGTAANTFNIRMNITGGYTSTKTVTSLAPGASQQVTFDSWTATVGEQVVTVYTQLGTDGDVSNDTLFSSAGVYEGLWAGGSSYPTTTYLGSGVAYESISEATNYLFSIGGNTFSLLGTECYKYNVNTDAWAPIAPLPAGRRVLATAILGDTLYAIGGTDMTGVYSNTVYKYNIITNAWTTGAPLPATIAWGKAVSYNNRIYLAGGYDNLNVLSSVYVYSPVSNTWSAGTSMPGARFGGALSITGNQLVYIAGVDLSLFYDDTFVGTISGGDPLSISWTTAAKYPGIGKESLSSSTNFSSLIKDNLKGKTSTVTENAVYPPGAIFKFDGAPWGTDGIIVAGGDPTAAWVPANPNPTYIYKPGSDTWTKSWDVPYPVLGSSLGSVNQGGIWKLIIASGLGDVESDTVQIWTDDLGGGAGTFSLSVSVNNGWNMVSTPGLHPTDQNVTTWWSGKDPAAGVFRFGSGYVPVTTTTPGQGYWMKHLGANTYNYPAIQIVAHNPIVGATGWNLIGGYELSVLTANITTTPAGLQTGQVFGYSGGYTPAVNLVPGYGYWIKLSAPGSINIPNTLAKGLAKTEVNTSDWGKIIITDKSGNSYTLYTVKGEVNLNDYELPPAPPTGMFDVRFGSGRYAEELSAVNQTIELNSLEYPVRVRVENTDIRLQDGTGNGLNERLKSGEEVTISNSAINKLMVSGDVIPATYSLDQNYPNPFNPSTKIEFSIPEDVNNVTLTIYNALGQRVAELVNSKMEAGKYSYVWNASDVATGLYIYELRTDKFVSVKKMMLLK